MSRFTPLPGTYALILRSVEARALQIGRLGRLDVLPVHDLGVRRGFQIAYRKRKMPEPEQLERLGEKWRPYRTVAARYLWRAVDAL